MSMAPFRTGSTPGKWIGCHRCAWQYRVPRRRSGPYSAVKPPHSCHHHRIPQADQNPFPPNSIPVTPRPSIPGSLCIEPAKSGEGPRIPPAWHSRWSHRQYYASPVQDRAADLPEGYVFSDLQGRNCHLGDMDMREDEWIVEMGSEIGACTMCR